VRFRKLGKSGIEASVVALGTWAMGGGSWWGATDDQESIRAVEAAVDSGINFIDTAPAYGFGHSETLIGKAISGRRDRVVVGTKCGILWSGEPGVDHFYIDGHMLRRNLLPESIRTELEGSLKRLGTDHVDLYQTHWPSIDPDKTPIADTMGELMKLKAAGKIRAIGVCNVSAQELKENMAAGEVSSCQFRYSLVWRDAEKEVVPLCRTNGLATLAYQPLEQGLLTGKVTMQRAFQKDEIRSHEGWNPWFKPESRQRVLAMLEGWRALAGEYGCTLAQLVIACTVQQPGITHVLCGARRPQQAKENAAAADIIVDAADVERISRESKMLASA
jgi:methylglyoxal reductase